LKGSANFLIARTGVSLMGVTGSGSDLLGFGEPFFTSGKVQANVKAVPEGNEWVINGQKSAWVSGAPVATHVFLHLQVDLSRALEGFGICIVPLDLKGVSKGKL
jgi:alkylation response protein AidB-like acyl-CoA dehydrogenase